VHLSAEEVALAREWGCWIVQNPRSNEGNRVGYPAGLAASHRVALGTDGYPADMAAEAEALRQVARAHGEEGPAVEARTEAGWALLAERFGAPFAPLRAGAVADAAAVGPQGARHVLVDGRLVVRDGELVLGDLAEIEAGARLQAARLWKRMAEL
jgi:cytosine/adenosine deaminase-related metal-dependent hydrolase